MLPEATDAGRDAGARSGSNRAVAIRESTRPHADAEALLGARRGGIGAGTRYRGRPAYPATGAASSQ